MTRNKRKFPQFKIGITLTAIALLLFSGWFSTVAARGFDHERDNPERFKFAIWGDMPYNSNDAATKIPKLVDDINNANVAFTAFDGDLKSGSSRCDNVVYSDAIAIFNSFKSPTIYVPGDNEWTDCHRTNNGGYNSLERLNYIRSTMFNNHFSFGQRVLRLEHQGKLGTPYSENTRWMYGNIQFVGLNVPGSNNNKINSDAQCTDKSARSLADCTTDNEEYKARNAANIAYLRDTFNRAKKKGAIAVMVIIQADPGFDIPETESVDERAVNGAPGGSADGYTSFLDAIVTETRAFKGQVVLVHGDTHFFKIDKPLIRQDNLLNNFTRVETFGNPNLHWVKVSVDPRSRNIFSFEPMIVPGN
jgi:hypothetical protein